MDDKPRSATATVEGPARLLYIAAAWLALLLALAGALLPLIPGTPFLLVAVWAAARGSRRLHDWIHAQPMLARLIDDWHQQGAIPRYAKWLATLMLLASLGYLYLTGFHWTVVAGMAAFFAAVAGFIWSRPDPVERRPLPGRRDVRKGSGRSARNSSSGPGSRPPRRLPPGNC